MEAGQIRAASNQPSFVMRDNNADPDEKATYFRGNGTSFYIEPRNDAETSAGNANIQWTRVGKNMVDWMVGRVTARWITTSDAGTRLLWESYTAADLADATHAVNTTGKQARQPVWDATNEVTRTSLGGGATDGWKASDGSGTIIPS